MADEPVMAGPPGARYRIRKFLARNRTSVIGASLVAAALIVGIIATTTAMIRADRNALKATAQTERAMQSVDFLLSTLSLADPATALNPEVTVQTLLDHTAARIDEAFADYPGAEVRVRGTIGRAYARLGRYELAEPHLRRVVEMADAGGDWERDPDHPLRAAGFDDFELYSTLWALTNVCFNLESADSFSVFNRAHAVGMAHLARNHADLANMLRRFMVMVSADAWSHEPDAMQAVPSAFERAVHAADAELADGDPNWIIIADTLLAAGYTVWYTPHEPIAEQFWNKALEIQRRELAPDHPDIGTTVNLLVGILNSAGRLDESERLIRDSVDALRRVHREGAISLAVAEAALGATLSLQGRYADAEPLLLTSHGIILATVQDEANFIALESFVRIVQLYEGWGRDETAKPYRESLARSGATGQFVQQWVHPPSHAGA